MTKVKTRFSWSLMNRLHKPLFKELIDYIYDTDVRLRELVSRDYSITDGGLKVGPDTVTRYVHYRDIEEFLIVKYGLFPSIMVGGKAKGTGKDSTEVLEEYPSYITVYFYYNSKKIERDYGKGIPLAFKAIESAMCQEEINNYSEGWHVLFVYMMRAAHLLCEKRKKLSPTIFSDDYPPKRMSTPLMLPEKIVKDNAEKLERLVKPAPLSENILRINRGSEDSMDFTELGEMQSPFKEFD